MLKKEAAAILVSILVWDFDLAVGYLRAFGWSRDGTRELKTLKLALPVLPGN